MSGALKLALESVGFLAAGRAVQMLGRRRGLQLSQAMSTLVVLVVAAAALGVAGLAVSARRSVDIYRSGADLTDAQRQTAGAAKVTGSLARLGVDRAVVSVKGVPAWVRFTEWLRSRIPPTASYSVSISRRAMSANAHFWVQWRLLPRLAVSRPGTGVWVVLFDMDPPTSTPSARHVQRFLPGFALLRR